MKNKEEEEEISKEESLSNYINIKEKNKEKINKDVIDTSKTFESLGLNKNICETCSELGLRPSGTLFYLERTTKENNVIVKYNSTRRPGHGLMCVFVVNCLRGAVGKHQTWAPPCFFTRFSLPKTTWRPL